MIKSTWLSYPQDKLLQDYFKPAKQEVDPVSHEFTQEVRKREILKAYKRGLNG